MTSMKSKFLNITIGMVTGGVFLFKAAPHVFPQRFCRKFVEWERASDINQEVAQRCEVQLDKVLQKLDKDGHSKKIQLFICNGYSPLSAGSVWLPNGAVIGLPKYFLFEKEDDIIASGLSFRNRPVNLKSKLGATLVSSLIATDDNIAFLIGHELGHIHGSHMLYDVLLSPTWIYASYYATFRKYASTSKRFSFAAFICKIGICCVSYFMYCMTLRWIKLWQEHVADRYSADLDLNMALGGVDFTLKKLKMNRVLRVLYGSEGKKLFSEKGEVIKNSIHPKLTERLRILEEKSAKKMEEIYQHQVNKSY